MLTTAQIIARLLIAALLSGLIGLERDFRDKPAGLRTNILVGLGSALAMILSLSFPEDPARIAAGVITGIGFIGAGLIIQGRSEVQGKSEIHGITTAASIWLVSAIGLTVGAGYYLPAMCTTVIALVILFIFSAQKIRRFFKLD